MRPVGCIVFVVVTLIAFVVQTSKASAVSAAVAKACSLSLAKAFPPREPGNPAAGSASGSVEDQRRFFAKCVARGGHMNEPSTKVGK